MNDKVTLQNISDLFASQYGISKRITDAFGKSFFDTIIDGLNQDGVVKIKGLGTFKIVDVSSRESVDVNTGERILIEGYRKVTFVPDELVELQKEDPVQKVEGVVSETTVQSEPNVNTPLDVALQQAEEKASEEVAAIVLDERNQPDEVETPKDEFSGIDNLIPTPESIDELKKELGLAEIRSKQTLEEAKQANIEYRRLQLLLERLEKHQASEALVMELVNANATPTEQTFTEEQPAVAATATPATKSIVVVEPQPTKAEETTPKAPHEEAFSRYISQNFEDSIEDDDLLEYERERKRRTMWFILLIVILILGGVAYYLYRTSMYEVIDVSEPEDLEMPVPSDTVITQDSHSADATPQATAAPKAALAVEQQDAKKVETMQADKKAANAKKVAEAKNAVEAKKIVKTSAPVNNAPTTPTTKPSTTVTKPSATVTKPSTTVTKPSATVTKPSTTVTKPSATVTKPSTTVTKPSTSKSSAAQSSTPKTIVMTKGDNLTKISQRYYGDKDHVSAIIKANNFRDPNNVPVGSTIKLP